MSRVEKASDFGVPVPGIGHFIFGQKSLRDQAAIEAEYARLTEGVPMVTVFLDRLATAMADLKVMTVSAPDGWDIDAMDAEDQETYDKLFKVWRAYRDQVETFRQNARRKGAQGGSTGGQDGAVLVSPKVPAGAD